MLGAEVSCPKCEAILTPNQTHCACGRPTALASFADRAAYELSEWQTYKGSEATAEA